MVLPLCTPRNENFSKSFLHPLILEFFRFGESPVIGQFGILLEVIQQAPDTFLNLSVQRVSKVLLDTELLFSRIFSQRMFIFRDVELEISLPYN